MVNTVHKACEEEENEYNYGMGCQTVGFDIKDVDEHLGSSVLTVSITIFNKM
jgi:hypothetical protein